jgi:tetratricopeptide (TPR) repeat protein
LPVYRQLVRLKPESVEAGNNLGILLRILGQMEEAVAAFQETARVKPEAAAVRPRLALAAPPGGQPLVPDHAALPATVPLRLGGGLRSRGSGAARAGTREALVTTKLRLPFLQGIDPDEKVVVKKQLGVVGAQIGAIP